MGISLSSLNPFRSSRPSSFIVVDNLLAFENKTTVEKKIVKWNLHPNPLKTKNRRRRRILRFLLRRRGETTKIYQKNSQSISFAVGDTIGKPTEFTVTLTLTDECEENHQYENMPDNVNIYVSLKKCRDVWGFFSLAILSADGSKRIDLGEEKERLANFKKSRKMRWDKIASFKKLEEEIGDNIDLFFNFTIEIGLVFFGKESSTSWTGVEDTKLLHKGTKDECFLTLSSLLESGLLTDFKIMVPKEDKQQRQEFNVHRNILAARCPIFKKMFEADMMEKETGEVFIPDMTPVGMKVLLEFIYSGELSEDWRKVPMEIIQAADRYQLPSLKNCCASMLHKVVNANNALEMVDVCKQYDLNALEFLNNFLFSNVVKVVEGKTGIKVFYHKA